MPAHDWVGVLVEGFSVGDTKKSRTNSRVPKIKIFCLTQKYEEFFYTTRYLNFED